MSILEKNRFSIDSVSVKDFAAVGDGEADDTLAIQAALDSGAREVRIPAGEFVVSDAIRPHSGQSVALFGILKVVDSHVQRLTAPANAGDDTIEIANASSFRKGQWVTLLADNSPKWQTRQHADCGRVAAIEGNRLRLDGRLSMSYLPQAHPRVGTQHSAIWLDNVSDVRGNQGNQGRISTNDKPRKQRLVCAARCLSDFSL